MNTYEMTDGSVLELDPDDGTIRRRDKDGNSEGVWVVGLPDYGVMASYCGGVTITRTYGDDNESCSAKANCVLSEGHKLEVVFMDDLLSFDSIEDAVNYIEELHSSGDKPDDVYEIDDKGEVKDWGCSWTVSLAPL